MLRIAGAFEVGLRDFFECEFAGGDRIGQRLLDQFPEYLFHLRERPSRLSVAVRVV
jgi:hypothetical protein